MFCKKDVLKNFTKFTRRNLCWSLFFNKIADIRPETLSKNRLQHRCFPVNFVKYFKNHFFTELLRLFVLVLYLWKQYTFKLILILLSYHSLSKRTKFTLFCMIWRTFRFILKYDCYLLFV